jgi:hypothetical protein
VAKIADFAGNRPAGPIFHAASEIPSGAVQIVDMYESAEAHAAFAEERLFPAFAEAGVLHMVMARPRPVAYEAFELVT